MPRHTKESFNIETGAMIGAIQKALAQVQTFPLNGVTYTRAELIAALEEGLAATASTVSAKARWADAVAAEAKTRQRLRPLRNAFRRYVEAAFGATNPKLQLFGFKVKQPAKLTVETRLATVEKRKATREARKTMGKNQKKKIKGAPEGAGNGRNPQK